MGVTFLQRGGRKQKNCRECVKAGRGKGPTILPAEISFCNFDDQIWVLEGAFQIRRLVVFSSGNAPSPLAIVPNGFVNVTPEVIWGGIEKYCDFAFVHEAWKGPFFPRNEVCFHPASRQLICLIRIFE